MSQIQAALNLEFKASFTRGAICGKVDRLGMGGTRPKTPALRSSVNRERHRQSTKLSRRVNGGEAPRVPLPEFDATDVPDKFACTLLELTNDRCRWPYGHPGEAGFAFCGRHGADNSAGSPYCPPHHHKSMDVNRRVLSEDERRRRSLSARRMHHRDGPRPPFSGQPQEDITNG